MRFQDRIMQRTKDVKSSGSGFGGFTLAEVLVVIGLMAILMSIYGSVLYATFYARRAQSNTQATNFLQEELDALRTLPFSELTNRTNGRFLALPVPRGTWIATADATAVSAPNVLALRTAQTAVIEETGLVILPGNYRTDFTLTAKIRARSASPAGWGVGLVFRYRDAENHYRFRFTSGGLALDKVVRGTKSTVWSQSTTMNTGTWYTLSVVASGTSLTLKKDGVTLTTVSDTSFGIGDLGVISLNGGLPSVDDVSVTTGPAGAWNFDADPIGKLPTDWQRMSYADLPSGTGTLTITDYLGETNIKQCTATIGWNDGSTVRSSTRTVLISN